MNRSKGTQYPTVKQWEEAGASLMIAIKDYMNLSLALGTKALREGILPEDLAAKIEFNLDATHSPMSHQLAEAGAGLSWTRNDLVSPLHKFPAEVMSEIFKEVVYDCTDREIVKPPYMEQDVWVIYRRLYTLLGVCSTWKNIVINKGALWSVIPVIMNPRTRKQAPFQLSLRRSKESKLLLAANVGLLNPSSKVCKIIDKHGSRINSMNLIATTLGEIRAIIEGLLLCSASASLSKLSLRVTDYFGITGRYATNFTIPQESNHIIPRDNSQHASFQSLLEGLTALHISSILIHWETLNFSARLNELRIDNVALGYDEQVVSFLHTLSSASELRDLKIISVVTFHHNLNTNPITKTTSPTWFPKLRSLLLQDIYLNTLQCLLRSIAQGSHRLTLFLSDKSLRIKSLEVNEDNEDDNSDDETENWGGRGLKFTNLCKILEPIPVDTLIISGHGTWGGGWLTETMFRPLLQAIPSVKTLKIDNWMMNEGLWGSLRRYGYWDSPTDAQELPFPVLESIYLTKAQCFRMGGLREMVASHPLQRLVLEETAEDIKNKLSYSSRQPEEDTINLINWLRANVRTFHLKENKCDYSPEFYPDNWRLW